MQSATNALGTVTEFNAVVVWQTNAATINNFEYLYQVGTGNNALSLSAAPPGSSVFAGNYYFLTSSTPAAAIDSGTSAVFGAPVISSHIIQTSLPRNNLWINGTSRTLSTLWPNVLNSNGDYSLGRFIPNSANLLDGYIAEVIFVVNQVLTAADRQKLEGYLAHKWGLEANLPVGHPYKVSPP